MRGIFARPDELRPGHSVEVWVHHQDPTDIRWPRGIAPVECVIKAATVVKLTELEPPSNDPDAPPPLFPTQTDRPDLNWQVSIMLDGKRYTVDMSHRHRLTTIPEHHDVCGACGEISPCRERRMDREAAKFAYELANMCTHCGKPIGSAWSRSFAGRRYHTAKKYRSGGVRCCDAAEQAWQEHLAALPEVAT